MFYNQKVDFHSHYLSPTYYEYLDKYEGARRTIFPRRNGVKKATLNLWINWA